ncbi:MAG: DUF1073 domain-containing protein [Betaproteobacteria bacterium]|nr:DUF1073 domain-containing protein [Betaproteobacteria bacterium]
MGLLDYFKPQSPPAQEVVAPSRPPFLVKSTHLAQAAPKPELGNPWQLPELPKFALDAAPRSGMAMDDALQSGIYAYAMQGARTEGIGFLGFPYLAELSQRPEYRLVSTIFARECTRKWIKFSGDEAKCDELEVALDRYGVQAKFRELVEHDGFFGRAHLFIDLGDNAQDEELSRPLIISDRKIKQGGLKGIEVSEPFWIYPLAYETANPLSKDFYRPNLWQVMTSTVHRTRLLTFVGNELPDMLKPSYAFAGLSRSQMIKPYVDNWLGTRDSVADLLRSFSTMVVKTDMTAALATGTNDGLINRMELFSRTRDNRGLFMLDKESEDLANVSTPLGTLDALQKQALEQICYIAGIPATILLGDSPDGLNATSDGELRTFYNTVAGYQERVLRAPLEYLLQVVMLSEWGEIDEDITFEFMDLWEMDEEAKARIRKSDADADVAYAAAGIVSPEEVRERIVNDEDSPWFGLDLSAPAPELPDDGEELKALMGGEKDDDGEGD